LINQHPKIEESAINGYRPVEKQATKEDEIVAHIVVKKGEKLTTEEFSEWSNENLPKFMRPRYVIFKDSLPKTATQRIQRFILRDEGVRKATKLF
jgi:crotonobetaine/carnitine-CoA ligase